MLGFAQRERQENGCAYLVCARRRLRPRSRPGEGTEPKKTWSPRSRRVGRRQRSARRHRRERERDSGARGVKGRRKGRGNPDPGPVLWFHGGFGAQVWWAVPDLPQTDTNHNSRFDGPVNKNFIYICSPMIVIIYTVYSLHNFSVLWIPFFSGQSCICYKLEP